MVERKKLIEVDIPLIGRKISLVAYNKELLDKKTIRLDLTRELRGKSIEALFKIALTNDKLEAAPIKASLLKFYIRRMIRNSTSYVEDSFSVNCLDASLRLKFFLITRKKVSRAVRNALRIKALEIIKEEIKSRNYEEIFKDILEGRFQKNLSLKLKKIYPLAMCEIREIKLEKFKENEKIEVQTEKVTK